MEKSTIKHFLSVMANAVIGMETAKQEAESALLKAETHLSIFKNALLVLLGYFGKSDLDTFIENTHFPTSTDNLKSNQESNGFQEIVSKPVTKSIEEIIREVKEMIIELKIKGSVREHRNGLLKFTSTMFDKPIYGRSKEEIEKKLKEKIKEFNKNKGKKGETDKKIPVPLLSVFYRLEYLPYKINDGVAESTVEGYESYMKFIVEEKFDKPLNWYKPKDIEDFLYSFPQTRKRQIMQGFLNNMLKRAITVGHIKNNPCDAVEKVKHKQEQGTAFSFVELKEFLKILCSIQHLSYADKCYFIFVFLSGARRDEARLLTVDDVDFENKILHIPGTKTDGSDRDIPLTPIVERLLLSLKVQNGRYFNLTDNQANKKFRVVWEKKKGHKLHDLRHTFGTIKICVEKIDVKTVSLLMGHSTVDTTLNRYTHPEQLDKGTFLNGSLSETEKVSIYKTKYEEILAIITSFLG